MCQQTATLQPMILKQLHKRFSESGNSSTTTKKNKQFQMPHYKTSVRFDLQWISCALNRIWLVTCHHSNGMLIDEICLEATKHGLCHENERESVTKTVFFFSGFHSICISWINRKSEYKKKRSCTLILKQDVVWIALD